MKMKTIARLMPLLALGLAGGHASAAGFQLLEQNASGIGNAYAGSAAVAENASTIFFNPAGMTQLKDREISAGVSIVRPTFKFRNGGSNTGALSAAGTGNDAGSWAFLPNGYLSWALNKDLYVGVGFGAPFGLVTEYDNPWVGGAHSLKFDIKTYNINPSIAYRINDRVSIGGGINIQRMEVEYVKLAGASVFGSGIKGTLSADDTNLGWNVGALFTLSPTTKVGLSYRSKVKHNLEGSLKTSGNFVSRTGASARVDLPDTFILSVSQALNERWEMLGDISWTGWSSIPGVNIVPTVGTTQVLDTKFRDTWRYALGANYRYSDTIKLKFGLAYDQTPVPNSSHRLVSLPDNNRTWFTTGAQIKVNKDSNVDVGVAYLNVPESHINNTTATGGNVKGTYDARVWILGAQYSMAF